MLEYRHPTEQLGPLSLTENQSLEHIAGYDPL